MLRTWSQFWHRVEEGLLVGLMSGMALVSCAQIALRNLWAYTLPWAEPLVQQLLMWSALVGALVATRQGRHLRIDLLLRLVPHLRPALEATGAGASALICALLCWVALRFVHAEALAGGAGVFGVAVWKLQLVFPLAFGGMALRFAGQATKAGRAFLRGRAA
ncbi:MAG: TRAP transporter small permease subunit [Candidatus Handelsmanbacteria bacterium]|nr:TRAP transporter small permease subunit [Candidatus Handelsmanbacteria bacterium]